MNKEKLLALGLTEEQVTAVLDGFNGYVPKSRFDEVNEAKKKALETISERDKQLEDLKKSNGDVEALKVLIGELQETNKTAKEQYEKDLNDLKISNAIELALTNAGARNTKAVKALLNLENLKLENEDVKGLAEQIQALKGGENSFLFKGEQKADNTPVGMKQAEGNTAPTAKPQSEWTYQDWCTQVNNQK